MFVANRAERRVGRIWTMFLAPALVLALALVARWWLPTFAERIVARPSPLDGLNPAAILAEERDVGLPEELVAVIGSPLDRHRATVAGAVFSPDGKRLATLGDDKRMVIWDVAEVRPLAVLKNQGEGQPALAFSPDGQMMAVAGLDAIQLWKLQESRPIALDKLHAGGLPRAVFFAATGKRIAWGNEDGKVCLWDLSGEAPREVGWVNGLDTVKGIVVAADGKTVAIWGGEGGSMIRTYEVVEDRLRPRTTARMADPALTAIFAPDLKTMAAVDETNTVRLIDTATGKERSKLEGAGPTVAFRADGKMLATLTGGGTLRRVKLDGRAPDVQAGVALKVVETGVNWAVIAPDLQSLVCASGEAVQLWDLTGPAPRVRGELQGTKRAAHAVVFAPDGRTLAVGGWFPPKAGGPKGEDGGVQLWDLDSRPPALRTTLNGHKKEVVSLAFSRNGRLLASGSDDGVLLWDLVGGPPRKRAVLPGAMPPVAFAPNSKSVATANGGKIQLWDLSGELIREWTKYPNPKDPIGRITALAFTPDGYTLVTGTSGDTADLWTIGGPTVGKPESLDNGQQEIGLALAISPDGKRLAMMGTDGTLRLWELADGKLKGRGNNDLVLQGRNPPLTAAQIVFSPNSKYIASSVESGQVVVWNGATGKRLRNWSLPGEVHGVAFAPDSRHLAIANGNGTVYLLRLAAPPGGAAGQSR